MNGFDHRGLRRELRKQVRSQHPRLREALLGDARVTAANRGERSEFRSRADAALQLLRLAWGSDAFLAQAAYRLKTRLQSLGVPILPQLLHRLAIWSAQVSIGDSAVIAPGLYILHGQVVIDGFTRIDRGAVIGPFVTIGLRAGEIEGPTIGPQVSIGTGAKLIGAIEVGSGARIGANAVVVDDVPARTTVVGAPARPTEAAEAAAPDGDGDLA